VSRENVEVVRRAHEAWNRGDVDAAAESLDPEVEWRTAPNFPDPGTWRGRDEVLRRVTAFLEFSEELGVDVQELVDAGARAAPAAPSPTAAASPHCADSHARPLRTLCAMRWGAGLTPSSGAGRLVPARAGVRDPRRRLACHPIRD
jgi:hypothetical protein